MQLWVYSDYCNVMQSARRNFPPFLFLLCKTAVMLLPLGALVATISQLLNNNVIHAIVLAAVHEKIFLGAAGSGGRERS